METEGDEVVAPSMTKPAPKYCEEAAERELKRSTEYESAALLYSKFHLLFSLTEVPEAGVIEIVTAEMLSEPVLVKTKSQIWAAYCSPFTHSLNEPVA